jgi:hypothetical protein
MTGEDARAIQRQAFAGCSGQNRLIFSIYQSGLPETCAGSHYVGDCHAPKEGAIIVLDSLELK